MSYNNAFYAQSGGATTVINASAAGVIAACQHNSQIGKLFIGRNGILGAINDDLIDASAFSQDIITGLQYTPSSAFGSCRHKISSDMDDAEMATIFKLFKDNQIGYFFYNGGNDSQDTILKISRYAEHHNYPLHCIGIPKTIDNDLACTDHCPGYPSAAKFLATTTLEVSLEIRGMCHGSSKVFIHEVMGRHAGWLAAAAAYSALDTNLAPQLTLFPERPLDADVLIAKVDELVQQEGYCVIVASEGVRDLNGKMLAQSTGTDEFGHHKLGGAGLKLGHLIEARLGYKHRCALPDYIQRSARHLASSVDVAQAYALGEHAVARAVAGDNAVMLTIIRESNSPYQWRIGEAKLSEVANCEKTLPDEFISDDGFGITPAFHSYLQPLITGEAYPPYRNGIPDYISMSKI